MFFHTPAPLLLPSQRRELFDLIRDAGFDPHEFELSDDGRTGHTGQFAEIVHPSTGYYVRIRTAGDFEGTGWLVDLFPATETRTASTIAGPWQEVPLVAVRHWLELLARELDAGEDPWEQIKRERQIVAAEPDAVENTPFDGAERAAISVQLEEIKEFLRSTGSLEQAQLAAIERRLDYLEDAAGRLGRVDWRNTFVGVMLGLVVEAIAPPELVREVISLALRGLGHLFGGTLPELPPGY